MKGITVEKKYSDAIEELVSYDDGETTRRTEINGLQLG